MSIVQHIKRLKDARRMMRALEDDEWASENKMADARREMARAKQVLLAEIERVRAWAEQPWNSKPWPEGPAR